MPYYADGHRNWAGAMRTLSVGLWDGDGDENGEMLYDDRSGSSDDRFVSNNWVSLVLSCRLDK